MENRKQNSLRWKFDNSYLQLPKNLYVNQNPVPVKNPKMVVFNHQLAESLGLSSDGEHLAVFAGNQNPAGSNPIAQAYAGHQFGHLNMLGDGRAVLLGEHITPKSERFDIQLKGSGQTPFSRRGDGRAALAPMLREYIISEAMYALNIPTTRSLAVITTGEAVMRESILQGAVLTRVAASHIRVGTFEYAAAQGDYAVLKALADYTINRHYPELLEGEHIYQKFLYSMIEKQAKLIAKWQCSGFIHGVMNTDNVAISGETIDYGPCAFMDVYDPATAFSSIDRNGRYAYGKQPHIAQWNIARFAESILPLLHSEQQNAVSIAEQATVSFAETFKKYWLEGMRAKLGLMNNEEGDEKLVQDLLSWMHAEKADFTNSLRALNPNSLPGNCNDDFKNWHSTWTARLQRQDASVQQIAEKMNSHNPAIIPRNHKVEEALEAAENGDLLVMNNLLAALSKPFADKQTNAEYSLPPPKDSKPYKTFCGT